MIYQRGFIIPGLPSPYMLLAAGIAIAVSFGLGYWKGYGNGISKYFEFKANVEQAQETLRLEHERRVTEMARINREAVEGWQQAAADLDALRKRGPIIRVLPGQCPPSLVSDIPKPSAGTDGPAKESGPDPALTLTVEQCEARINIAIDDTVRFTHLQAWVLKQVEAK
jgi:hypothetical protein